jgi:hypothetical protein
MSTNRTLSLLLILIACFNSGQVSAEPGKSDLAGRWILEKERSTNIDPWRELTYDIRLQGSEITLVKTLRAGRYHQRDSMTVIPDDQEREAPMTHGKWMEQVHMGARVGALSMRVVRARWEGGGKVLYLQSRVTVETSQGDAPVIIERRFHISEDGSSMALTEARSTRTSGTPLVYDFSRLK